jgi:hypothetical protein
VSALASAPLELAAPERRPPGARRERRRLGLLTPPAEPLAGNRLPVHILDAWDSALDAYGRAFDAVERMKVYADAELLWRRKRLRDERRWLACLKEMRTYDRLPRLCAHPQRPVPRIGSPPMRTVSVRARIETAKKEECHDCDAHDGPRSGPARGVSKSRFAFMLRAGRG